MPRTTHDVYAEWKYRGRRVGYVRSGCYYIDRHVAGRRARISTGCFTRSAANAEYERFELNPAAYVNRSGCKALPPRPDPARAEQLRVNHLARRYSLTPGEYQRRLMEQGGVCAICGTTPTDTRRGGLDVDHDHATGAIRGLLCGPCNRGLGNFADSPDLLRRATAYLGGRCPKVEPRAEPEKERAAS